jgi:hypothetical protein
MIPTRRLLCCLLLTFLFLTAGSKAALVGASPLEPQKYWVFFRNKGNAVLAKGNAAWREAENRISPRALARRAKVMPPGKLITEEDMPIAAGYRAALESRGFEIIHESRWLNGVSILATEEEATALRRLPFVKEVRRVATLRRPPQPEAETSEPPPAHFKATAARKLDYGASLTQNEQIKATILHDAGINGTGIIVGMLDSGFRWQDHEAFLHLQSRIIAERDFVNNDDVTRDQPGDTPQDFHGTQTFSVLAGFKAGQLIGPGYGAHFLLAKTEYVPTETHAEEDNWAAAIEWMEGLGVDVTSTSLGYGATECNSNCCPLGPTNLYSPSDMDGNTAIITKAAEMAASRGVVVVNSAGNDGNCPWHIVTAPADGPNVIAVGAVNSAGTVAPFSSRGPTTDGRIKPDVMARGVGTQKVVSSSINSYTQFSDGTSFSCPLIGGVVAQILSAHPDLTPAQVMEALRTTASRANAPDNDYGYGIVDAKAAITYWGPAFSNAPEVTPISQSQLQVIVRILSKAGLQNNQTAIHYSIGASAFVPVSMTQIDSISYSANIPQVAETDTINVYFSAREINAGADVTYPKNAPAAFLRILGSGAVVDVDDRPHLPAEFAVLNGFPNPARIDATPITIRFQLAKSGAVNVKVFNLLGQEVATLAANRVFEAGKLHDLAWNGRDGDGRIVPSGVYFYQLTAGNRRVTRKIILLP